MTAASPSASVLELLHPLGHANAVSVIGRGCSADLSLCPRQINRAAGPADLVVLAPSSEEFAMPGWLEAGVRDAANALRRDGVLYVLAPRSRRRHIHALLRACGLSVASVVLHHPNWPAAGAIVPLEPQPLAYAFSHLIRTHPLRRRIALGVLRLPGALALARALLPCVGLVVQWRGAPPQATWFTGLAEAGEGLSGVVVNTSWRGRNGAVLLHAVDAKRGEATAIAKTWLSTAGETGVAREAAGLQEIAVRAGQFGVSVPRLLGRGLLGDQPFVAETAVRGEKAASVLVRHPEQLEELLTRLATWLLNWNTATLHYRTLTQDLLDELLLGPAAALLPDLEAGEAYLERLSGLAARVVGQPMPFVAAHGDLTMVNLLVDHVKHLGIIDWETASPAGLPLSDFFYAVVDAAAAVDDYRDRPAAFDACFEPGARYTSFVERLQARFVERLGLTKDQVALSFRASWLRFALDERKESAKTAPDEFLRIARQVAAGGAAHPAGHGSNE